MSTVTKIGPVLVTYGPNPFGEDPPLAGWALWNREHWLGTYSAIEHAIPEAVRLAAIIAAN